MLRFEMVGLRYDRVGDIRRGDRVGDVRRGDRVAGIRRGPSGPEVLHDINFHVPAGAFRWLLGPSGAGKTSMLRLLYLAVRPTTGRLSLLGTDVTTAPRRALPALRRRIGVVFQDFRLLPHLSTFDNVALPLRIAGRPEAQIRADVTELLRWVGLAQHMSAYPAALSGGEQQRVAIARAVITRPALLLADEPTGNMDDGQAERLMRLFKEMNRIGTTVIVATHNEALVARHPARALRLAQGRLTGIDRGTDPPGPGVNPVGAQMPAATPDSATGYRRATGAAGGTEADGASGSGGSAGGRSGADGSTRVASHVNAGAASGFDTPEEGEP
jgi:cell division transport system ATP-binding protein